MKKEEETVGFMTGWGEGEGGEWWVWCVAVHPVQALKSGAMLEPRERDHAHPHLGSGEEGNLPAPSSLNRKTRSSSIFARLYKR